jgi:plastocyanin
MKPAAIGQLGLELAGNAEQDVPLQAPVVRLVPRRVFDQPHANGAELPGAPARQPGLAGVLDRSMPSQSVMPNGISVSSTGATSSAGWKRFLRRRSRSTGGSGGGATGGNSGGAAPISAAIAVGNIFFRSGHNGSANPAVDTVAAGGTVRWTWTNAGGVPHSVESVGSPSFTSSDIETGDGSTYQATFAVPGTYQYQCAVHGAAMRGTIVVR